MKNHHEKPCQLIEKWISFEELDWDDWILAGPSKDGELGFYFNTCEGVCPFPMPDHIGDKSTVFKSAVCFLIHLGLFFVYFNHLLVYFLSLIHLQN